MIIRFFTAIWALITRKQALGILTACVLLSVFIGFLIASNYRNYFALHDSFLNQFRLDIEKRGASLGYFFSERKYDLRLIATSREINTYFNNKALGMSEQYGLRVDMFVINRLFEKTIKDKIIQGDAIYERFLLLDETGRSLVDTAPTEQKNPSISRRSFSTSVQGEGDPTVFVETEEDGTMSILVTVPCIYKNHLKGKLTAWVNPETLSRHFFDNPSDLFNKGFELLVGDGQIVCHHGSGVCSFVRELTPELLARITDKDFLCHTLTMKGKKAVEVMLIRIDIPNVPMSLLAWVEKEAYFDSLMPWHLMVGTGSLAIVIVLGVGVLMRFNTHNIILKKQFDESERQQELLALKNQQLKDEISKRHEAEKQLENQRTLSMRSDRLRSLGEMAAGIAHELNQPLVGVRGLAELFLIKMDNGLDIPKENLRETLNRIIEQADRMVHIIDHVRLFAREAGNVKTSIVDLNDVVRSSISLLTAQFKSHGLELKKHLVSHPLTICVNPYSVEEVFLNLLNNARDAVEKKHEDQKHSDFTPCVEINTGCTKQKGKHTIWATVKDNGTGIAPSISDKIFDPFYTTKDPDKGTGLGLSICKSIVEEFGGNIQCDSVEDEGSVFTVKFPAYSNDEGKNDQT